MSGVGRRRRQCRVSVLLGLLMSYSPGQTISWATIANEFRQLREELEDVDLPSPDEIDCYKAALVAPALVRSNLLERLELNQRHWIKSDDRSMLLRYALSTLGLVAPDDALPKYIRAKIPDHMAIVESSIRGEVLTLEFLHSWGQLQKASALLSAMFVDDGAAHRDFLKQMNAAVAARDTTVQQYWYAHWVSSRDGAKGSTKSETDDELAELCADISQGRRKPLVFDRKWFGMLIEKSPADPEGWVLKTTYRRKSRREIRRMVANKLIPKFVLPPVKPEDFPLMSVPLTEPKRTYPEGGKPRR
jgi:hypothetical protein